MSQDDTTKATKPYGLGRGLAALLAEEPNNNPTQTIPIAQIVNDPEQPRRDFRDLDELAQSLKAQGMLQPVLIHPADSNGTHRIIAGERRWRAAQLAKLDQIPVRIIRVSAQDARIITLVENIQRSDLNPIETARGMAHLCHQHGITHEELSPILGKSRSHITNLLRLLSLPETVQVMVGDGALSMGHARVLVGRDGAQELAETIIAQNLSVRQAEALAMQGTKKTRLGKNSKRTPEIIDAEDALSNAIGMRVTIQQAPNTQKGKLIIHYDSLDAFDHITRYFRA
ncbi:MAG: ParB/RepB/Spo0J family partition protein [Pseudomonadota bacterium]